MAFNHQLTSQLGKYTYSQVLESKITNIATSETKAIKNSLTNLGIGTSETPGIMVESLIEINCFVSMHSWLVAIYKKNVE
jgi:hypothetical protein